MKTFGNREFQRAYIEGQFCHSLFETTILQLKMAQSHNDHTTVVSEERFPPVKGLHGNPV
ncbi:MAG TPA: hypothetical protein VN657_07925 [Nitrospiraceae bacterium]|nr:hypothetical protein [Nitrospiraceae bacterium]